MRLAIASSFEADLVAELEAVGDGRVQAVDADRRAVFDDGLDAIAVGIPAQARDAQCRAVKGGRLRGLGQCDPDLERELGTDLVELKRGEQADDGLGDTAADLDEALVRAELAVGQAVEAARDTLRLAAPSSLMSSCGDQPCARTSAALSGCWRWASSRMRSD